MAVYHIGTSGWHYAHWKGIFYPQKLPKADWLDFYARHFSTLEVNNTFYHLPSENAFANWRESSPAGFTFAVKVSRFITHVKKLRNAKEGLDNFLGRARLLQEKLGPLLYQLPPNMKRYDEVLETFLSLLPPELLHAFEFRNEGWFDEGVFEILRQHRIGFCIYDMGSHPTPVLATADFAYIRFHGSAQDGGCYSDDELKEWTERIAALGEGLRAVYIYFNNDAEGFALRNAQKLRDLLG